MKFEVGDPVISPKGPAKIVMFQGMIVIVQLDADKTEEGFLGFYERELQPIEA